MSSAIRLTLLRDVNSQLQHLKLHAMSDMRNYSMMRLTNWPEGCDVRDWYVSNKSRPYPDVSNESCPTHVLMTCSCHRNG